MTSECSMPFDISVDINLAAKVMEGVEYIESEADLLNHLAYGMKPVLRSFRIYLSTLLCVQLKWTPMMIRTST